MVLGRGAPGVTLAVPESAPLPVPAIVVPSMDDHTGPWTPALRTLQGRMPLVKVASGPASLSGDSARSPSYDFAVFDDGTVAYEGQQCVKVGGLSLTRLSIAELQGLRDYLGTACATEAGSATSDENELCARKDEKVQITCSTGKRVLSTTERCSDGPDGVGKAQALANELASRIHVDGWIGTSTERQACEPGASALSAGELRLMMRGPESAASRFATRQ